jgi:hypothetical protein
MGLTLRPLDASWTVVGSALFVGIWGASIALYIHAAQRLGATRGQIVFATAPFFGLVLSAVCLGENLRVMHLVATLLFVCAITLLLMESHAHRHKQGILAHAHQHRHDDDHHMHRHLGLAPATEHTHWHEHAPMIRTHPHWSDMHHRHTHGTGD